MPGRTVTLTWQHEPTLYAPAKYRRACRYDAFIPDPLSGLRFSLDVEIAGVVSEAEAAIHALNESARPALAPLARLLLRSESIASSKIEGMQLGVRELARADAAAWAVIGVLPAHPLITAPVAAAATGRSRPAIYQALDQLQAAGVLVPLSGSRRNQSWEAVGLLDLLAGLEAGELPVTAS